MFVHTTSAAHIANLREVGPLDGVVTRQDVRSARSVVSTADRDLGPECLVGTAAQKGT